MRNKKNFAAAAIFLLVIGLAGCETESGEVSDYSVKTETESIEEENEKQNKDMNESQEESKAQSFESNDKSEDIDHEQTNAQLEEELKRYRQEREDTIKEENGLVEGGTPDEDSYSFDMSKTFYSGQFDTREVAMAHKEAETYITDTLKIKPDTKLLTYMCIDPRMLKIYEDEDKGVAKGYDSGNIFLCEYCDEGGAWKYIILVRDGKESEWKVIYSGSSYKE